MPPRSNAETLRLAEGLQRSKNWERWGPYLAERQWGTVREDYSPDGACWDYFPHDHARSRAYRWGEDGLFGLADRECRLCFALALWNECDPILKERLFGLTNAEGNHGEDVKECYFYLNATPTYSYLKALYKYPQREFPCGRLVEENRRRGRDDPEFELLDTGIFDDNRYFDGFVEYAKAAPDDILIRITVANRGPEAAPLHLLPTIWFRNTWSWGRSGPGYWPKPKVERVGTLNLLAEHATLGRFHLEAEPLPGRDTKTVPTLLFTDNETNLARLFGAANPNPYVKDAFHRYVIDGCAEAVSPANRGTKAAAHYRMEVPSGQTVQVRLRLVAEQDAPPQRFGDDFDAVFASRIQEADEFYVTRIPTALDENERRVVRQAYGGLLWSKQFYHYTVKGWLEGDPAQPGPPGVRWTGRNHDWTHLFASEILSMPDKWEYPWFAAWDLAFHTVLFASLDPNFAKQQQILLLREWYMHPNGQIPAYEFAFNDVNPPIQAWAAWRVYKISERRGGRDRLFLERVFQKLLLNFTWWVNREDVEGNNIFSGGFLGLDNIGVFDRSKPLPSGESLEQADGTAWMAFFCVSYLRQSRRLEFAPSKGAKTRPWPNFASVLHPSTRSALVEPPGLTLGRMGKSILPELSNSGSPPAKPGVYAD